MNKETQRTRLGRVKGRIKRCLDRRLTNFDDKAADIKMVISLLYVLYTSNPIDYTDKWVIKPHRMR